MPANASVGWDSGHPRHSYCNHHGHHYHGHLHGGIHIGIGIGIHL